MSFALSTPLLHAPVFAVARNPAAPGKAPRLNDVELGDLETFLDTLTDGSVLTPSPQP